MVFLRPATAALALALSVGTLIGCAKEETAATTAASLASSGSDTSAKEQTQGTVGEGTTSTTEDDAPGTTKATTPSTPIEIPEVTGDFCADLKVLGEKEDEEGSDDPEVYAAVRDFLIDLQDEGPAELDDAFETFIAAFDELMSIEEGSKDELERALEIVFDPEFIAAGTALNDYGRDECGFEEDVFDVGPGPDDITDPDPSTTVFGDDGDDTPSIGDRIEAAYESAPWWDAKNGHSISSFTDSADISFFGDWTGAEALEVCDAIGLVITEFSELTITVSSSDTAGTVLAHRDATTSGACVPG